MQLTPKYGPAQHIVLRARFWPLPIVAGVLHHQIDASEAVWHLDTHSKVTIDLPKIEEKLWPGTPAVFTMGPGPLAEYQIPALPSPDVTPKRARTSLPSPEPLAPSKSWTTISNT